MEISLHEFLNNDNYAKLAGIELLEMKEGYARTRMMVEEKHLNGAGVCQGGAIFTLADLAFAAAVNSHLQVTVSISANISFFQPAHKGYLFAEAHEIVNHHRLPYAEVKVTDADDNLIAILTSTGYRKKETLDSKENNK